MQATDMPQALLSLTDEIVSTTAETTSPRPGRLLMMPVAQLYREPLQRKQINIHVFDAIVISVTQIKLP